MRAEFTISGLKELDAGLAEFKKATARTILQRALLKAAAPIEAEAVRLAPVQDGPIGGRLKRSIKTSTKKPKGHSSKAAFAAALRAGATRAQAGAAQRAANRENGSTFAEVFVGPGADPAAWPQEIGTAHHGPQPYMRPAVETQGETALNIMTVEIRNEITAAAKRSRARAARKAAKG